MRIGTESERGEAKTELETMKREEANHPRKRRTTTKILMTSTRLRKGKYWKKENNKDSGREKWINGQEIERKIERRSQGKGRKIDKEKNRKIETGIGIDKEIEETSNLSAKKKKEEINKEICKKVDKNKETEAKIKSRGTEKNKEIDKHPRKDKEKKIKAKGMKPGHFRINNLDKR